MSSSSILDEMIELSEDIESIFQTYILTKSHEDLDVIHCFFEGTDDYKYYCSRICSYTDKDTVCYDCKGKDNVLTLYGMIKDNTINSNDDKLLFFIDKDFDIDELNYEDIYITPCYSIENFYITDNAFSQFLKGELQISRFSENEDKLDFEKALNFFKDSRTNFINRTVILNVWYSLQKNKSRNILNGKKPDLTNLKSVYNNKNITFPIDIEKLKILTPNYLEVTDIDIQNEKNRLMADSIYNLRGKYYEEFLFKILNEIITDSNKPQKIFSKKRKVNLTIGKDNLISILSQYADTPGCLKKYLCDKLMFNEVASELETS